MKKVILVTGGARSGKSRYALEYVSAKKRKAFIATATAFDKEMSERITKHREERSKDFLTIEEPIDLAKALRSLPRDTDVVVVDCLTVWMGNLLHRDGAGGRHQLEIEDLLEVLRSPPCEVILVTNEVGMGIVPDNEMGRYFRDIAGSVNARVAQIADTVVLLVSGVPLIIKGKGSQ
ncbi:MAG: bifunctional adenosylcobinamide kinase/adenosylcobinamide-phosphate guanylyltransferase [bacterium]